MANVKWACKKRSHRQDRLEPLSLNRQFMEQQDMGDAAIGFFGFERSDFRGLL